MRGNADTQDMRYSGRNTSTDCQFCDPFLSSRGSGVHANRKYRYKRLFFENIGFNHDLSLQFSGPRLVAFFATGYRLKKCLKAAGSPLLRSTAITSENCEFWQGLSGFLCSCEECCCVGVSGLNFSKKMIHIRVPDYDESQAFSSRSSTSRVSTGCNHPELPPGKSTGDYTTIFPSSDYAARLG